eukprot:263166-Hanusia_phi.AAC.1
MFLELLVTGAATGPPVLYEDNFFSLLPGEQRVLRIQWEGEGGQACRRRSFHRSLPPQPPATCRHFDSTWSESKTSSSLPSPPQVNLRLKGYNVELCEVPIQWQNV